LFDHLGGSLSVADIALKGQRPDTQRFELCFQSLRGFSALSVIECHVSAASGQFKGDRSTDTTSRTGDYRSSASKCFLI
jgi:hypothetical protein